MQTKGSGNNVRDIQENKKLTPEETAEQKKAGELKSDMDNQAQFFELRQKYLIAILSQVDAFTVTEAFASAHALAAKDFRARCAESVTLLKQFDINMRIPGIIAVLDASK